MYVSGHILTSVLVARGVEKRFRIGLGALAAVMIAASLVDADHLLRYYLDDGTASSFVLHPLHQYWYAVLGVLALAAVVWLRARAYLWAAFIGVALHYVMDLAANAVHYSLYMLLAADVVCYIVALVVLRRRAGVVRFLSVALVVPTLVSGFLLYVLKIAVDGSPIYHIMTIIELVVAAVWARRVFSR